MDVTRRSTLKLGLALYPAASALAGMLSSATASAQQPSGPEITPDRLARAHVCFRIGVSLWERETRFLQLLELLDANRGVTDEITLFTSETHPPLPLQVILARAPVLRARMETARAHGYRAGINVLSTLGHMEENLANSLDGDYTQITDSFGAVCRGAFCPNDERLRAYAVDVYTAMAGANPDYIWVDDDVRLWGHGPIDHGCFCDRCMELFSARAGRTFTRDSLREALSSGPPNEQLHWRRLFAQLGRESLSELFGAIEGAVHRVAPGIPLGFMTGGGYFEGYAFDEFASALAGPDNNAVWWRPGGGNYRDERLSDTVDKTHEIGRQLSGLPESVLCIESEVESFPYQRLKKSAQATALEAAAYIAGGCTGAAFNVLSMYDEPLDEYGPLVAHLHATRPFLDILARTLGRSPSRGLHCGWVRDSCIANNVGGPWFAGMAAPTHCNEIWATGLPPAYHAAQGCVTAWSGDQVLALTDDEVRAGLASGVYIDGPALTRLNERGFGALTGFETAEVRYADCMEEMTDHALNVGFGGRSRNGRQAFWRNAAHFLQPTAEGAQALTRYIDYSYRQIGPCAMGVFENSEGGRVCVAGYYPWEQLQTLSKASQIKAVMRWLSGDALPAYIASYHRANLWVRQPDAGPISIVVLNAYFDPADDVELMLQTDRDTIRVTDMRCSDATVQTSAVDGPYCSVRLPAMAPWELLLVTA